MSNAQLLRIFRAFGVSYVTRTNWNTHNRPGDWGPDVHGVMIHHTGRYASERQMMDLLWDGYEGLPGPLCHAGIAKDGTAHMVGHGRANHAGTGDSRVLRHVIDEEFPLPAPRFANGHQGGGTADGNRFFYGLELLNRGDGKDPWPEAQLDAAARMAAGICAKYGWTERSVIGHKEWQAGKIDPTFSMSAFRSRVRKLL
ncbi:N-acetylmuramoyl-L-alanine amidase [Streptomyces sp. NBC_00470]|uniref:peptidoglycan recognition protein family protein n=1 Tax=Streptomyces sp. NBC_00470 TaxID=2975753 RepID=UPI00352BEEDC